MEREPLLHVKNLKTHFSTEQSRVTAVDGITFEIRSGETVALVGESGCGKSVTSLSILRLFPQHSGTKLDGEIWFEGQDLLSLTNDEMEKVRGNRISMIFQDPMTSLNPVYPIGDQIAEAFIHHQKTTKKEAMERAIEMLKLVGIPSPEKRVHEYPHQLSGGMRQRVMIAMGLACNPRLLIADEPTTALDVTIQAQILELMERIKQELDMGIMLITHDLGVVAEVCSRVMVMYLGQIVEDTTVERLFECPRHPYTMGLMQSIPRMDGDRREKLHVIKGIVPSLHHVPTGCRFAPRCPYADEKCVHQAPDLESFQSDHKVRCWHHAKIVAEGGDGRAFDGNYTSATLTS